MDVTTLMRQAARLNASFPAIVTEDRTLTFAEAWDRGVRLANALIALGAAMPTRQHARHDKAAKVWKAIWLHGYIG